VHSPSLFKFLNDIVFDTSLHVEYQKIERNYPARIRNVKRKYGRLLCRIIKNSAPPNVLEITSVPNIMSLYISAGNIDSNYYCISGRKQKSSRIKHFAELIAPKWKDINGSIKEILPGLLNPNEEFGLIYLNRFKNYSFAYEYFETILPYIKPETIVIVNSIHRSDKAEKFWEKLTANDKVRQSLDLFEIGILFFGEGLQKENFVVKI
ncbi:MAG: hypothetical protein U9R19_01890, partial [Bacteroidota bacterium]|nr:hypothetical protein [Bacteroidota bacterium]